MLLQFQNSNYRILVYIALFVIIYNIFRMYQIYNDSTFKKPIDHNDDLKVESLHIVPDTIHRHVTNTVNDNLFVSQGPFQMPSHGNLIHGHISDDIFPSNATADNDRIWSQMRFVPPHLMSTNRRKIKEKVILLYNGLSDTNNKVFEVCPVNKCRITDDRELAKTVDVIMWMHNVQLPFHKRPPGQIWAIYLLESPVHTYPFPDFETQRNYEINWTATYRRDSTLVTPYYKYTPYDLVNPPPTRYPLPSKNYAAGKTKMIAWFVSNCASINGRIHVAYQIKKYTQVDIYGRCGSLNCPRRKSQDCFTMLNNQYKFYLAFENSNCKDYITEKFFLNGLSNNVIPIVMGATPRAYKLVSPPHSYIHIEDFDTIKKLVDYLKYLDRNDTAYNEYFSWKGYGKVDTNTFFWCRLCMMAHEGDRVQTVFKDAFNWWFGSNNNVCIGKQRWKDQKHIED